MDFAAAGAGKGKRGEDIAILQHHRCTLCLSCLASSADLPDAHAA
jgi:hypothetical protein